MTPSTRIQAAIEKLEAQAETVARIKRLNAYYWGTGSRENDLSDTLIRTIPAQLNILNVGAQFAALTPNVYTDAALNLADAILGTET